GVHSFHPPPKSATAARFQIHPAAKGDLVACLHGDGLTDNAWTSAGVRFGNLNIAAAGMCAGGIRDSDDQARIVGAPIRFAGLEAGVRDKIRARAGEETRGAEMIGVGEESGALGVLREERAAEVNVAFAPARIPGAIGAVFGDDVAVEVVDVIDVRRAGLFFNAMTESVVEIAGGRSGAGAEGAFHLHEAIFGVVEIVVRGVLREVAGGVVLIGRAGEAVIRVHGSVEGVAGAAGDVLIGGVAAGLIQSGEAVEGVIGERASEGLRANGCPTGDVAVVRAGRERVIEILDVAGGNGVRASAKRRAGRIDIDTAGLQQAVEDRRLSEIIREGQLAQTSRG